MACELCEVSLVHKQQQRETNIMGSSAQLDFGLEEHMPISAIGARAHLIGLVLFAFWGV